MTYRTNDNQGRDSGSVKGHWMVSFCLWAWARYKVGRALPLLVLDQRDRSTLQRPMILTVLMRCRSRYSGELASLANTGTSLQLSTLPFLEYPHTWRVFHIESDKCNLRSIELILNIRSPILTPYAVQSHRRPVTVLAEPEKEICVAIVVRHDAMNSVKPGTNLVRKEVNLSAPRRVRVGINEKKCPVRGVCQAGADKRGDCRQGEN